MIRKSIVLYSLIFSFIFTASVSIYSQAATDFDEMLNQKKKEMEELLRLKKEADERDKAKKKIEAELAKYNDRLVLAEQVLSQAEAQSASEKKEIEKIQTEQNKMKKQQAPIREALADLIDERSQLRKLIDEKQKQFDDLNNKIEIQKQKLATFQNERNNSDKRLAALDNETKRTQAKVQEAELIVVGLEKEINNLRAQLKALASGGKVPGAPAK